MEQKGETDEGQENNQLTRDALADQGKSAVEQAK